MGQSLTLLDIGYLCLGLALTLAQWWFKPGSDVRLVGGLVVMCLGLRVLLDLAGQWCVIIEGLINGIFVRTC